MKSKIIQFTGKYLSIVTVLSIFLSCEQVDPNPDIDANPELPSNEELMAFTNEITDLQNFEQPEELSEPVVLEEGAPERDAEDESLECYTTYYKAAPGFDEMLALDPTTDVIFPGAILKGETIPTGEYIPILSNRAPITLSASLQKIEGSPVVEIEDPSLSTVREGIKSILDQKVTGATEAHINYDIFDVYSEEQLKLALGINYRSASTKISASFDFSKTTSTHKFVLRFLQVYYTIDMDLPENPGELFTELPDISSLGSTSPVYVSTVTYGRMIIYTIESSHSKTDIKAAFDASFASSDGSIDAKYEKIINESNIKALVIGGSGSGAAQTITGPQQVYEYISEGGNYSNESPGAPLSYKLRYLKDNSIARVVLSSEYPIRTCDLAYPVYNIELISITCKSCQDGDGSAGEVYGHVWAYVRKDGKRVGDRLDWDKNRNQYITIAKGKTGSIGMNLTTEVYRPNYDVDHVLLGGRIREADLGGFPDPDDSFGDINPGNEVRLKDIPYIGMKYSLDFGEVTVNFKLTRLK